MPSGAQWGRAEPNGSFLWTVSPVPQTCRGCHGKTADPCYSPPWKWGILGCPALLSEGNGYGRNLEEELGEGLTQRRGPVKTRSWSARLAALVAICLLAIPAGAGEILELYLAKPNVLVVHIVEVPLYLSVTLSGLSAPASYTLSSADDPSYSSGRSPSAVKQKRKQLYYNAYTQTTYKQSAELWFALTLPSKLTSQKTYTLTFAQSITASTGAADTTFVFDEREMYSAAIHVNNIGFLSDASMKYAYVSHYLGEAGGMVYSNSMPFRLMNVSNKQYVFSGTLSERSSGTGDYKVRVWQCDFSSFSTAGEYKVVVPGIGCSHPFAIGEDSYRRAFQAVCRGMFHQRCACEITPDISYWVKPRCHHSDDIPAYQSTSGFVNDDPQALKDKATSERIDCWGGWHDAGDHDHYQSHMKIPYMLFATYELNPNGCGDGELNLPESGNGIPDIIDEAKWGVDLWKRMQKSDGKVPPYTTPYPSPGSLDNTEAIYACAPTNEAGLLYAGMAAAMGYYFKKFGKSALATEYITSAKKSYGVSGSGDARAAAALWLWRATGDNSYHNAFKNNRPSFSTHLYNESDGLGTYLAATYVFSPGADAGVVSTYRNEIIGRANDHINKIKNDAMRVRKKWDWMGGYTLPTTMALPIAYKLTGDTKYRDYHALECDYYLGGNPLNMTWITQFGEKHPTDILHVEARSRWGPRGLGAPLGIVPYGPAAYYRAGEPTSWCGQTATAQNSCYPSHSEWSIAELWFEWPAIVCNNEYTVHQTVGPSIFAYGGLCADRVTSTWPKPSQVGIRGHAGAIRVPGDNRVSVARNAGTVRVSAPAAVRVDVLDISGRRLAHSPASAAHTIRLDSFVPGPYIIHVKGRRMEHAEILGIER